MDRSERFLVVSALGPDRPGLVAEVTDHLTAAGCNIEDSRMAILGAEFGMMILVSGTPQEIEKVIAGADKLAKSTGLGIVTRPTKSPEEHRRATVVPWIIRADSLDQEGIVRAFATELHRMGINIVSMQTEAYNAPVTGSPLFRLEALVDVPREISHASFRDAMAKVAERENVDVDVELVR